jgi:hypothetical protein
VNEVDSQDWSIILNVDNEHFLDYANYLKSDNTIPSRRTLMRRLEEMYTQKKL